MGFLKKSSKGGTKNLFFTLLGIILGVSGMYLFLESSQAHSFRNFFYNSSVYTQNTNTNILPFQSKKSKEVLKLIKNKYIDFEKNTEKDIEDAFLSALVQGLTDKNSKYMTEKEYQKYFGSLARDTEGIGTMLSIEDKGAKVFQVLKNSPAEKVQMKVGDIITHVDDMSIIGIQSEDVVAKIRGKKGTSVKIGYIRGNEPLKSVDIVRDSIFTPSVVSSVEDGIATITIVSFGKHTSEELLDAIQTIEKANAKALIIDLRDNVGGFLVQAIAMVSTFLPDDSVVVKIQAKDTKTPTIEYSQDFMHHKNTTIPIVILVNEKSASASEIFAGALQDHKRAVIVGNQTFGKGSVQDIFPLSDGSFLKITISRWYTPNEQKIDEQGITPDIKISLYLEDYISNYDRQLNGAKTIAKKMIEEKLDVSQAIEAYKNHDFTK